MGGKDEKTLMKNSLYELIDGVFEVFYAFRFVIVDRVDDAMLDVVFHDALAGIRDGGTHRRELNEYLAAIPVGLHHPLYGFQVSDGTGQAVQNRFLIFCGMYVPILEMTACMSHG